MPWTKDEKCFASQLISSQDNLKLSQNRSDPFV